MSTASDLAVSAKAFAFNDQTEISAVIYELASQAGLLSMTPSELAAASKCYCFDEGTARGVIAYLLAVKAGLQTTTPADLAKLAKCFCFDRDTWKKVVVYLLESGGGGTTVQDMQVAWTPTNLKLGEELGFFTFGNIPGITTITFSQSTSIAGFDIEGGSNLTSLSWPNLISIDPTNTQGGYLAVFVAVTSVSAPLLANIGGFLEINSTACPSVSLPSLTTVGGNVTIASNTALTSISLTSLSTIGGNTSITGNALLTSIDVSSLIPANTKGFDGSINALSAATVNLILHRHVLNAGYVSGTIDLSGGTNAAPSGAGVADKATLIGRGVTVLTN